MQLLFTLFIIALSFFLLGIGVIISNKQLKGSCGGNDDSCSCSALEKKMCKAKSSTIKENTAIYVQQKNKELGYVGFPNKIDTNWKLREEIARYETFALLILSLFFLSRPAVGSSNIMTFELLKRTLAIPNLLI